MMNKEGFHDPQGMGCCARVWSYWCYRENAEYTLATR